MLTQHYERIMIYFKIDCNYNLFFKAISLFDIRKNEFKIAKKKSKHLIPDATGLSRSVLCI